MIKVLIADDEKHARDRVKELLSGYDIFSLEYEAKNGDEVLNYLINNKIDVAFLDINMPGISVLKLIAGIKKPPSIVFQTAYSVHAVDAFGLDALDYLLKPITKERFEKTVEKIIEKLDKSVNLPKDQNIKSISVKKDNIIKIIKIEEIFLITFSDSLTFLHTNYEKYIIDCSINYYEEKLSKHNFFRVNRNDLINLDQIKSIHPMFNGNFILELKNKLKVKLSRRRTKDLKDLIKF